MSKLNLVPNEVKGYRIRPDQWNWTVVIVKVHGKESKNEGVEYEKPLAYCKNLSSAVEYIMRTAAALEGRKEQDVVFDTTGVAADMEALQRGFIKAQEQALAAVQDLEKRLVDKGYDIKEVGKVLTKGEEISELEKIEE